MNCVRVDAEFPRFDLRRLTFEYHPAFGHPVGWDTHYGHVVRAMFNPLYKPNEVVFLQIEPDLSWRVDRWSVVITHPTDDPRITMAIGYFSVTQDVLLTAYQTGHLFPYFGRNKRLADSEDRVCTDMV